MPRTDIRAALTDAIATLEATTRRFRSLLDDLDSAESVQVPRQGRWTKAMVEQLWVQASHLSGVRALFEETARRPNEAVTFTQVVRASGLDERSQRNEHARLSRIAAGLFGEKRWPIENWQGSSPRGGGKAEMLYRMGGTVAAWWNELAA